MKSIFLLILYALIIESTASVERKSSAYKKHIIFPLESFIEKAEKRVKLDLLFAELINHYDIKVEKQHLDDFIDEESKRYKEPEQYKKWITGQPQQLEQFKMIVLEKKLVEKLENVLKSKKKVIKFSELASR